MQAQGQGWTGCANGGKTDRRASAAELPNFRSQGVAAKCGGGGGPGGHLPGGSAGAWGKVMWDRPGQIPGGRGKPGGTGHCGACESRFHCPG